MGLFALLAFLPGAPAGAQSSSNPSGSSSGSDATSGLPPLNTLNQVGVTQAYNSGGPNSSVTIYNSSGDLVAYGNSSILYKTPPASYIPAGEVLFAQFCSSCHGTNAQGTDAAPNLVGLGPATVDFWVSTGRMPAKGPYGTQAPQKPALLNDTQALQIAAWVNSLAPATPFVPTVNTTNADVAVGAQLFALNCAACHTITGAGDALAKSTFAPSLHSATATQIAEAIRTGPGNMPRFTGNMSDAQVRDVTAYVTQYIQKPTNPGGFGLGGIGPVAEGFVALLFGVGGLMLVCYWIGERT
jgi:ubiquinol-cytochrome c reductase cytochrome c subunit